MYESAVYEYQPFYPDLLARCAQWLSNPAMFEAQHLILRYESAGIYIHLLDHNICENYEDADWMSRHTVDSAEVHFAVDLPLLSHTQSDQKTSLLEYISLPHVNSMSLAIWDCTDQELPVAVWTGVSGKTRQHNQASVDRGPILALIDFLDIDQEHVDMALPNLDALLFGHTALNVDHYDGDEDEHYEAYDHGGGD